jgi:DNA-directed RNA polymerase subunit beta'
VLIAAATSGKVDNLYGLKENVILGRRIPVGTGAKKLHCRRRVRNAKKKLKRLWNRAKDVKIVSISSKEAENQAVQQLKTVWAVNWAAW